MEYTHKCEVCGTSWDAPVEGCPECQDAALRQKIAREIGPVETLCKEIGFRFDSRMERTEIFVSFVSVLVETIAERMGWNTSLAEVIKFGGPTDGAIELLDRVRRMLAAHPNDMIALAALAHDYVHEFCPEDANPTDHDCDMLSSCISAIRFGLEKPCRSRHAASAAEHIWRKRYGVTLADRFTSGWQEDWARAQMQEAILRLHLRAGATS